VAANVFQLLKIALADQDLLFIMRGLYDDSAKRIAEEGAAPEFQALALGAVTANVAEFMPDAVYRSDKHAVSNGVRPLNRAPGIVLRGSEFSLFIRMPADCGGIKENVCSLKGREPRAFGIPLVPANQRAHAAVVGIKGLETQIARREVKLFVIERIVRNMHLAVEAVDASVGVQHYSGVVVQPARSPFKDGNYDYNVAFAGNRGKSFRGWSRN